MQRLDLGRQVYERVRDFVVSQELPPGAKVDEDLLARKLGVSRSPVREALSRLSQDGIVEIVPNRGAFKIRLGPDDIMEIMEIRAALHGLAIRLAARRVTNEAIEAMKALFNPFENGQAPIDYRAYIEADKRFHDMLDGLCGRKRLLKLIDVFDQLSCILRQQAFRDPRRVKASLRGHLSIIEALEQRDPVAAEKRLRKSIAAAADYLIRMLGGVPDRKEAAGITGGRHT